MSVGTHKVSVSADLTAGAWSAPLASNPYFTTDLVGWKAQPFSAALVWLPDGSIQAPAVSRDPAFPVNTPMAAAAFRVRGTVTVDHACTVFFGAWLGKTAAAAAGGPFWNGANAVEIWSAIKPPAAGTYSFDATFDKYWWNFDITQFPFISPRVNVSNTSGTNDAVMTTDYLVLDYKGTPGTDISCLVDEVSITHGRDGASGQPDSATATVSFTATPVDPLPAVVEIGSVVTVTTTPPPGTKGSSTRFVGRVTDLALGWDDNGEDTPDSVTGQLIATAPLADLGRRVIGDAPYAVELDGARVARIMTAAGVTLDAAFSDPGLVQIRARDIDRQPALDVARAVADDAGGLLWHTRDGQIRYADAGHRRGVRPTMTLDACDVLVTPTWKRTTEGLINQVSIGYGADPADGSDQPRSAGIDNASVAKYGLYYYTAATQLAAQADADALVQMLIVRNNSPVWVMSDLPVDVDGLTDEATLSLLGLDVHSLLNLTGLPAAGSAPTSAVLWVEGIRERLAYGVHEIDLVVSGYCRTAPPPRWNDLDPALTWDTVKPTTLTWDQTTCLGPSIDRGRWDDAPASLRWDLVDPAITWDTYQPA